MGFPWKAVFNIVRSVGEAAVPGAAEADAAVQAAINAKSGTEREDAIFNAAVSGLETFEAIDPSAIADPALFKQGVIEAHDAAAKIQQALTKAA